jgi:hypothetical protein
MRVPVKSLRDPRRVLAGFIDLKTVNHFLKIKEEFSVNGKIFSIDYYFTSQQASENTKNIFRKSFYVETNE